MTVKVEEVNIKDGDLNKGLFKLKVFLVKY